MIRTPTMCKVEAALGGIPAIAISVTQKARMEQKKSQNCKTCEHKHIYHTNSFYILLLTIFKVALRH
jgi:broad specificity polyphosphatase/5'/3'-nucleotidase SurE